MTIRIVITPKVYLQMCDVIQDSPGLNVFTFDFDKVKIDGMKHERQ